MKLNINPATLFAKKEGSRIRNTLLKARREVVPVKLAALLKRNFLYETLSSKFLRIHSFEVLWVACCDPLYNQATLSKVNKKSNDICRCQQNICSEKIQKTALCKCSTKYVFLKISQDSQENARAGVTF